MPPRKGPPPEQTSFLDPIPETRPARNSPRDPDYRPAYTPLWEPTPPPLGPSPKAPVPPDPLQDAKAFLQFADEASPMVPAPTGVDFDGQTYDPLTDYARLSTQLRDVWDCLTHDPDRWWSISDLTATINAHRKRHHTEAAVSARLRDLRKPKFGRYVMQRKPAGNGLFYYRLDPVHYRNRVGAATPAGARP
jgi:hypothetical protein